MARPKKLPSPVEEQVRQLAAINCTWEEIAIVIGMSLRTCKRRFGTAYKKGIGQGRMSLKRKMWESAMNGNTTMMIWLSKQILGYTDKVEERIDSTSHDTIVYKSQWAKPEATVIKDGPKDS